MSFLQRAADWLFLPPAIESKNLTGVSTQTLPQHSPDAIEAAILSGLGIDVAPLTVSAVRCCARVIAEGLALPSCYVRQQKGNARTLAPRHPLYPLLNESPNDRQTAYEFREMLGWNLALHGNAFVFVSRSARDGSVLELMPCDPGFVSVDVEQSRLFQPIAYYLLGQKVATANIWHLKGPSWLTWTGINTVAEARHSIALASATEHFGANLFKNGAKPSAIITPADGTTMTEEQFATLRNALAAQVQGVHNAHKPLVMSAAMKYQPMATAPNDAQWLETRRFQIEEICRHFRVSPTKVFQQLGRCLIPQCGGTIDQHALREELWARFYTAAPGRLRQSVERYSGVKRA